MHKIIRARNVQEAYLHGMRYLQKHGEHYPSRNGSVLVAPGPVMTEYARPMERVIMDPGRDANPFFHLMEAFWMLAGREDVASISYFNSNMKSYSDDGVKFNAPYGHRWRVRFGFDQIVHVVEQLKKDYATRRAVIQMWDGFKDGVGDSKDYPCNTAVYFRAHMPRDAFRATLDMTITNRSNDIIWGAYGANAVHMSVLHEFVAAFAGMNVGRMYQLSNNYHAYTDIVKKVGDPQKKHAQAYNGLRGLNPTPLFSAHAKLIGAEFALRAIEAWWERGDKVEVLDMNEVMSPDGMQTIQRMRDAYAAYKSKNYGFAMREAWEIPGEDWSRACIEWLQRRDK